MFWIGEFYQFFFHKEMNGRWFSGRRLVAQKWDGVTKYDVEETEEEKEERLKKWEEYLERKGEEQDAN